MLVFAWWQSVGWEQVPYGICANSWLRCCWKHCHFVYAITLGLCYGATEVRRAKFCLVPNTFFSPETLQSLNRWVHLTEGKGKIITGWFYSPRPWERGWREENYTACLHMSNLKYCREPGRKECFSMYPVYPFPQTITCTTVKNYQIQPLTGESAMQFTLAFLYQWSDGREQCI